MQTMTKTPANQHSMEAAGIEPAKGSRRDQSLRVLVTGSREWTRRAVISLQLAKLPVGSIVMHGDARGADRIAAAIAESLDLVVEDYPADWKRYGRKAGILRNFDMLDAKPDLVLAFWDGTSRGTKHVIEEAERRGIPIEVYS